MGRGLIFTIDALIAVILIMILASFIALTYPEAHGKERQFYNFKKQTDDASVVGTYLAKDATAFGMDISLKKEFTYGNCAYGFDYGWDPTLGPFAGGPNSNITLQKYCKGSSA